MRRRNNFILTSLLLWYLLIIACSPGRTSEVGLPAAPPSAESHQPAQEPEKSVFSDLMVGAYYYGWWRKPGVPGGHWRSGGNDPGGNPEYTNTPVLGEYDSREEEVINRHIAWAKEAGIDFFAVSWWGPNEATDITLKDYYLNARRSYDIKFCIHYESLGRLGGPPVDLSDPARRQRFLSDFEYLAETYFNDPRYLRIKGRPVVIIYAVRDYRNADRAFAELKTKMRAKGFDPFLIADVVWWTEAKDLNWTFLSKYFDAITGYNLYSPDKVADFKREVASKYQEYKKRAMIEGLAFIPSVMPGFDNRKTSQLPRSSEFFEDLWHIASRYFDQELPLIMVTSFNEWHEGTEVEPSLEYGTWYLELLGKLKLELLGRLKEDLLAKPLRRLFVIDPGALRSAELVMLQGLQGILSQSRSEENIWLAFPDGYEVWLRDLNESYNVVLDDTFKDRPWELVEHFRDYLSGYILYNLGQDSENVAITLAGVYRALPITPSLRDEAERRGLKKLLDVRGRDERWCFKNYFPLVSRWTACLQREDIHDALRDYAVATKAFTFYDGDISFIKKVFKELDEGGIVLGWGRPEEFRSERELVAPASKEGLLTIAADWAHNLSVLSRFRLERIEQRERDVPEAQQGHDQDVNVHYVTFIMSDGDNVQWLLNDFATDERWFGSSLRGDFPMGWTISPSMWDLSPTVMKWLYDQATPKDFFIAGASGRGYFYPSKFPHLKVEAERLNWYMGRAGLNLVFILDDSYYGFTEELLSSYASQPNIVGGFWAYYEDYAARKGEILFVNGKPFVSVRYELWEGKGDPSSLAAKINALPADPYSPLGYSVVVVHPWSRSLKDVKEVIDHLDPQVRVVRPDEFILLITENLEKRQRTASPPLFVARDDEGTGYCEFTQIVPFKGGLFFFNGPQGKIYRFDQISGEVRLVYRHPYKRRSDNWRATSWGAYVTEEVGGSRSRLFFAGFAIDERGNYRPYVFRSDDGENFWAFKIADFSGEAYSIFHFVPNDKVSELYVFVADDEHGQTKVFRALDLSGRSWELVYVVKDGAYRIGGGIEWFGHLWAVGQANEPGEPSPKGIILHYDPDSGRWSHRFYGVGFFSIAKPFMNPGHRVYLGDTDGWIWVTWEMPPPELPEYIIVSDTSWKTADKEEPGWTELDFDDSDWLNAEAPWQYWDWTDLSPAKPMWYPGGHKDEAGWFFFRKTFTLPSGERPRVANLAVQVDDDFVLFINGREVARDESGITEPPSIYEVSRYLHPGRNVIAIKARDSAGGNEGVNLKLEVGFHPTRPARLLRLDAPVLRIQWLTNTVQAYNPNLIVSTGHRYGWGSLWLLEEGLYSKQLVQNAYGGVTGFAPLYNGIAYITAWDLPGHDYHTRAHALGGRGAQTAKLDYISPEQIAASSSNRGRSRQIIWNSVKIRGGSSAIISTLGWRSFEIYFRADREGELKIEIDAGPDPTLSDWIEVKSISVSADKGILTERFPVRGIRARISFDRDAQVTAVAYLYP